MTLTFCSEGQTHAEVLLCVCSEFGVHRSVGFSLKHGHTQTHRLTDTNPTSQMPLMTVAMCHSAAAAGLANYIQQCKVISVEVSDVTDGRVYQHF